MFLIVVIGVAIGSIMPIAFKVSCSRLTDQRFGLDPAHASAAIQVIMDILGVTVVMLVCQVRSSVGDTRSLCWHSTRASNHFRGFLKPTSISRP